MDKDLETVKQARKTLGELAHLYGTNSYTKIIGNNLLELEQTLTPPTAEEVCQALIKDTKIDDWYYNEKYETFYSSKNIFGPCEEVEETHQSDVWFTNKTRLLIARFYESLVDRQKK